MTTRTQQARCSGQELRLHVRNAINIMQRKDKATTEKRKELRRFYLTNIRPLFETFFQTNSTATDILTNATLSGGLESALGGAKRVVKEMYFGENLCDDIDVIIAGLPEDRKAECEESYENGAHRIVIKIDILKHTSEWEFFGSLVHEFLHAVVRSHRCHCRSLACITSSRRIEQVGLTGHGQYFQMLADAAEKLSARVWKERRPMDMGIRESVIGELECGTRGKNEKEMLEFAREALGWFKGGIAFNMHFSQPDVRIDQ